MAAQWRSPVVAEILLERRDVNPDAADLSGRTPFSWAAFSCTEETVRLLLARNDVNPNTLNERGRTPLAWAAVGWGNEPSMIGRTNRGQDDMASGSECAMVAKLLLERSDLNPDSR